jgi:hypothetical protein
MRMALEIVLKDFRLIIEILYNTELSEDGYYEINLIYEQHFYK